MDYLNDYIIVEESEIFIGTRYQFMDCFFSNADDEQIKSWCLENGWSLNINDVDIL